MITETDKHIKVYSGLFDKLLTQEILNKFGWITDESWLISYDFYKCSNYPGITIMEHPKGSFKIVIDRTYELIVVCTYGEIYKLLDLKKD